ncbi:3-hydroxy-fatty acyl-ACP dehydratase [Serratia microhaemolytica]|uniref:ApeP family dehydratase n=1 Tax=Serratia microhaemolytica TaxID=2675110 RepID=UPI000FDF4DFB|nr:3-hydroxy-fatty acyl-ACP dehydratase [Serratia microhaemolytica]
MNHSQPSEHYLEPAAYLPHDAPMLLLEQVISVNAQRAHCRVTVNTQGVLAPFVDPQGELPGWYALELMAQTVGVWSGWHRLQNQQQQSSLGMVLGARELTCASGKFAHLAQLEIEVELLMQDGRFGSFECQISIDQQPVATGRINTFQPHPEELASLLNQGNIA